MTKTDLTAIPTLATVPWRNVVSLAALYNVPLLMSYMTKGEEKKQSPVRIKAFLTEAYFVRRARERAQKKSEAEGQAQTAAPLELPDFPSSLSVEFQVNDWEAAGSGPGLSLWRATFPEGALGADSIELVRVTSRGREEVLPVRAKNIRNNGWYEDRGFIYVGRLKTDKTPRTGEYRVVATSGAPTPTARETKEAGLTEYQEIEGQIRQKEAEIAAELSKSSAEAARVMGANDWVRQSVQFALNLQAHLDSRLTNNKYLSNYVTYLRSQSAIPAAGSLGTKLRVSPAPPRVFEPALALLQDAAATDAGIQEWITARMPVIGPKAKPLLKWLKTLPENSVDLMLAFTGTPEGWKRGEDGAPGFLATASVLLEAGPQPEVTPAQLDMVPLPVVAQWIAPSTLLPITDIRGFSPKHLAILFTESGIDRLPAGVSLVELLPDGQARSALLRWLIDQRDTLPSPLARVNELGSELAELKNKLRKTHKYSSQQEEKEARQIAAVRTRSTGLMGISRGESVEVAGDITNADISAQAFVGVEVVYVNASGGPDLNEGETVEFNRKGLKFSALTAPVRLEAYISSELADVSNLSFLSGVGIYVRALPLLKHGEEATEDILTVRFIESEDANTSRVQPGLRDTREGEVFYFVFNRNAAYKGIVERKQPEFEVSLTALTNALATRPNAKIFLDYYARRGSNQMTLANAFPATVALLRIMAAGGSTLAVRETPLSMDEADLGPALVTRIHAYSTGTDATRAHDVQMVFLTDLKELMRPIFSAGFSLLARYNGVMQERYLTRLIYPLLGDAEWNRRDQALAAEGQAIENQLAALGLYGDQYKPEVLVASVPWVFVFPELTNAALLNIARKNLPRSLPGGYPVQRSRVTDQEWEDIEADVLPRIQSQVELTFPDPEQATEVVQHIARLLYPTGLYSAPGLQTYLNKVRDEARTTGEETSVDRVASIIVEKARGAKNKADVTEIAGLMRGLGNSLMPKVKAAERELLADLTRSYYPIVWEYRKRVYGKPNVTQYSIVMPGFEVRGQVVAEKKADLLSGLPLGTRGVLSTYRIFVPHEPQRSPAPATRLAHIRFSDVPYSSNEEIRDILMIGLEKLNEDIQGKNITRSASAVPWLYTLRDDAELQALMSLSGTVWGHEYWKKDEESEEEFVARLRDRWDSMGASLQSLANMVFTVRPDLLDTEVPERETEYEDFIQFFILKFGKNRSVLRAVRDDLSPVGLRLEPVNMKADAKSAEGLWTPTHDLILQKPHLFAQQRQFRPSAQARSARKAGREFVEAQSAQAAQAAILQGRSVQKGALISEKRGAVVCLRAGLVGGVYAPEFAASDRLSFPRKYLTVFDRVEENWKMMGNALDKLSPENRDEMARLWAKRAHSHVTRGLLSWDMLQAIYGFSFGWGVSSMFSLIAKIVKKKTPELTLTDLAKFAGVPPAPVTRPTVRATSPRSLI